MPMVTKAFKISKEHQCMIEKYEKDWLSSPLAHYVEWYAGELLFLPHPA